MQKSDLKKELETALADEAQQQERVQAQTEKVESITLPYDYNDILGNPLANETIIEVLKQDRLQSYDEHNIDIDRIHAGWKVRLDELTNEWDATKTKLYVVNSELQAKLDAETEQAQMDAIEIMELSQQVAQLGLEKKDADLKRDAALLELSDALATIESQKQAAIENVELKAQVEALQQELTAKKALTVNGNDKLAELASKAKESTIEKANRGLARWNLPAIEVPSMPEAQPLAMPEIPAAQEEHPKDAENTATITEGDPSTTGNQPVEQVVAKAAEETPVTYATKEEHEALVARVATIERHANIQAVA
jgi:hypothetical protein